MAKLFSFTESIDAQMKRLTELRSTDIDKATALINTAEEMLKMANQGRISKFVAIANRCCNSDILAYYSLKMLKASLLNGHMMIAAFMIDNGFPLSNSYIPCILNDCIMEAEDYQGVNIVEFLVSKSLDVNAQAYGTWLTALHVAVQRQLLDTTAALISKGADVNAVAAGDKMPLTIALAAQTATGTTTSDEIVDLLLSKNARATWRSSLSSSTSCADEGSSSSSSSSASSSVSGLSSSISSSSSVAVGSGGGGTAPKFVKFSGAMMNVSAPASVQSDVSIFQFEQLSLSPDNEAGNSSSRLVEAAVQRSDDGAFMFSTGC